MVLMASSAFSKSKSCDKGVGFEESPRHENGGREKVRLHLDDIDAERRRAGPEIHAEILIVVDLLALVEQGMRQLVRQGKALPGRGMGAIHTDDDASAVADDQAGIFLEIHQADDNSLTANKIVNRYGGSGNACFTQQTIGELLDACVARSGRYHRLERARTDGDVISCIALRTASGMSLFSLLNGVSSASGRSCAGFMTRALAISMN